MICSTGLREDFMPDETRTPRGVPLARPETKSDAQHTPPACLLLVEPERGSVLRNTVPAELAVHHARDGRQLACLLAAYLGSVLIIDPALLAVDMAGVLDMDLSGWRIVADSATTIEGLRALWLLLAATPAIVQLRDHMTHGGVLRTQRRATDELLRAWTPMLRQLPAELSRAIANTTCGDAIAESVDDLAALAGRSRRWTEMHLRAVGVRSAWRIVVGSRIARAHQDLINPAVRSAEIVERYRFGSARTLRSQIECVVGTSSDVVRAGMSPRMLAHCIAALLTS
jgi:hypothetical protein